MNKFHQSNDVKKVTNNWCPTNSGLRHFCNNHVVFMSINSLRAKFFRGNINIYLHFMSLLHIDVTHVLKTLPQLRPGPTYST